MRSRNTEIRGRIALIGKGAKAVTGVAELVDLRPNLSLAELRSSFAKHRVPEDELSCEDFKWTTAWVLSGALRHWNSQFLITIGLAPLFGYD